MGLVCLDCDLFWGLGCLLVIDLWLVVLTGCVVFLVGWGGFTCGGGCFVVCGLLCFGVLFGVVELGFGVCGFCLFLVLLVLFEVGVLFDGLVW